MLIKDNHIAIAGGIAAAVAAVRAARPGTPVEVEVDTLDQLGEALAAGAETVLLDNMTSRTWPRRSAARPDGPAWRHRAASPWRPCGRSPRRASTAISVGALTHSVRGLDIALEVQP